MVQIQESPGASRLARIARVSLAGSRARGTGSPAALGRAPGEAQAGMKSDPRTEPVVLLKSRPGTRFQLLGMAEAKAPNRRSAAAGLAIRGSMMGADAVVDLNQERLPGFRKTEHRASGMAVRSRRRRKARAQDALVFGPDRPGRDRHACCGRPRILFGLPRPAHGAID